MATRRKSGAGESSGDRVAENGKGANQILAVESTLIDRSAQACRYRQTTLAHRTRLRRIEAGTWPGAFRRSELARISPSCNPVDRRIRVPGTGTMPFSLSLDKIKSARFSSGS